MISFIIPAYNEELELSSTIAAIRAAASRATQTYEIIVVDDASTDATPEIGAQAGTRTISINRRQIAAARNAGARAARGQYLFFVDADTRIDRTHIVEAIAALEAGYAGGSARVVTNGFIPLWSRIFVRAFCTIYFGLNLGAGAFLFTTRRNFDAIGGFDEQYFIGEEVYFSLALRKLGRFKVLREPILTSGRKLRMYSARQILGNVFGVILGGRSVACSRAKLHLWYDGKREKRFPTDTDGTSRIWLAGGYDNTIVPVASMEIFQCTTPTPTPTPTATPTPTPGQIVLTASERRSGGGRRCWCVSPGLVRTRPGSTSTGMEFRSRG